MTLERSDTTRKTSWKKILRAIAAMASGPVERSSGPTFSMALLPTPPHGRLWRQEEPLSHVLDGSKRANSHMAAWIIIDSYRFYTLWWFQHDLNHRQKGFVYHPQRPASTAPRTRLWQSTSWVTGGACRERHAVPCHLTGEQQKSLLLLRMDTVMQKIEIDML